MAIREQLIEYREGTALLEAFFCHDDTRPGPLPAVLIGHPWSGRNEFVERKARRLAWNGDDWLLWRTSFDSYGSTRAARVPTGSLRPTGDIESAHLGLLKAGL